jgi:hypothetical protein
MTERTPMTARCKGLRASIMGIPCRDCRYTCYAGDGVP